MVTLAGTGLSMCAKPQQTAKMNASYFSDSAAAGPSIRRALLPFPLSFLPVGFSQDGFRNYARNAAGVVASGPERAVDSFGDWHGSCSNCYLLHFILTFGGGGVTILQK